MREQVEEIYAGCGLTLTDAINIFIQQSINAEGLPFVVTRKTRAARFEQSINRLMSEIAFGEESAKREGLIDETNVLSEFGVRA